jgi:hypothetical protein
MPDGHNEQDIGSVRNAITELRVKLDERLLSQQGQITRLISELTEVTKELHAVQVKIASYAFLASLASSAITLVIVKVLTGAIGVSP